MPGPEQSGPGSFFGGPRRGSPHSPLCGAIGERSRPHSPLCCAKGERSRPHSPLCGANGERYKQLLFHSVKSVKSMVKEGCFTISIFLFRLTDRPPSSRHRDRQAAGELAACRGRPGEFGFHVALGRLVADDGEGDTVDRATGVRNSCW